MTLLFVPCRASDDLSSFWRPHNLLFLAKFCLKQVDRGLKDLVTVAGKLICLNILLSRHAMASVIAPRYQESLENIIEYCICLTKRRQVVTTERALGYFNSLIRDAKF